LKSQKLVADQDIAQMEKAIAEEIAKAVEFSEAGTWEPVEELTRFVYSEAPTDVQGSKFNVQSPRLTP
jgi:TPP-dependent pyruvate/acetoin dehydrogenase alpha subunit